MSAAIRAAKVMFGSVASPPAIEYAVSGEWINFTTFSDDAAVGTVAWGNPGNVETSDNAWASAAEFVSVPSVTHYLKCLNLEKKIPVGVTITGIKVRIERSTQVTSQHNDNVVSLVKVGAVSGDNKAVGGNYPIVDTYQEYGGVAEMWSLTFTPEQINDATTGVVLSTTLTSFFQGALVDHIQMAVTFS